MGHDVERHPMVGTNLALLVDLENFAISRKGAPRGGGNSTTQQTVRDLEVLVRFARVKAFPSRPVVMRAYADFQPSAQWAPLPGLLYEIGIEPIQVTSLSGHATRARGKNSVDIRLALDALEMCMGSANVGSFIIVSGDSDYLPLLTKLRSVGASVTVVGFRVPETTNRFIGTHADGLEIFEDIQELQYEPLSIADPEVVKQVGRIIAEALVEKPRWRVSIIGEVLSRRLPAVSPLMLGGLDWAEAIGNHASDLRVQIRGGVQPYMLAWENATDHKHPHTPQNYLRMIECQVRGKLLLVPRDDWLKISNAAFQYHQELQRSPAQKALPKVLEGESSWYKTVTKRCSEEVRDAPEAVRAVFQQLLASECFVQAVPANRFDWYNHPATIAPGIDSVEALRECARQWVVRTLLEALRDRLGTIQPSLDALWELFEEGAGSDQERAAFESLVTRVTAMVTDDSGKNRATGRKGGPGAGPS